MNKLYKYQNQLVEKIAEGKETFTTRDLDNTIFVTDSGTAVSVGILRLLGLRMNSYFLSGKLVAKCGNRKYAYVTAEMMEHIELQMKRWGVRYPQVLIIGTFIEEQYTNP
jgi:hypothetical protein